MYKHFDNNTQGRDFVCGDIHGCYDELRTLLDQANFDYQKDRLFVVGDLIDRGPKNAEVLDLLYEPWFHSIIGNHELMMLCATMDTTNMTPQAHFVRNSIGDVWQNNGGAWWYTMDYEQRMNRDDYERLINNLPLIIDIDVGDKLVGLVHAQTEYKSWSLLKEHLAIAAGELDHWLDYYYNDIVSDCVWSRDKITKGEEVIVEDVDHIFHGHTINKEIVTLGNCSYIDTGCFFGRYHEEYGMTMIDIKQYLEDPSCGVYYTTPIT